MSNDFMKPVTDAVSSARKSVENAYSGAKDAASNLKFRATQAYNSATGQSNAFGGRGGRGGPTAEELSAYAHSKATATDKAAGANGAPRPVIDFQPNLLDNYDTYTYHWKLFITPLAAATSGRVLSPSVQTVIAESGVSDLTIDKVEFNGIAVPSVEAGTGTQTLIKFEIVEPSGAGLLDKMFYQAVSLGIGNWLVMPCFLQLEFRGRDPVSGESVINGAPSGLGSLRWVWPLKITNMKANVTNVGTRYEVDAVVYDELAQSNAYFCIQHNTVLSGLSKFGKAMTDLEEKLNADQYEKLIDNYSIPDTYRIVVDPLLANIDIALPDANKHTSRGSDFIDFDKKVATYNTGTGIDKIVDSLLSSTNYFETKLQSADTRTSEPDAANKAAPMRKFWRIVTETKPVAFDMLRQDNAVAITIYIVQYDLGLVEATPAQTGQTDKTLDAAKKRIDAYNEKKILKKRYNYIFTGLNDQIVSFDLNMNFSFAASLSRFGGVYIDTASADKGVSQQDNSKNEQEATKKIRDTLRFINDPQNASKVDTELAAARTAIKDANIDPILKRRYANILRYAKPADRTAYTDLIIIESGIDADGELNRSKINAKSLAEPTSAGVNFVSDVDIYSTAAQAAKATAEASRKGKLRPIPFRESTQEVNTAYGIDPTSDAARARTASIFSTALYSTLDASLQMVKLTIKGDPYWLFPRKLANDLQVLPYKSNMSDMAAINEIKQSHVYDPNSVNLFGTDNFIVIRFRTPRIYNETTGVVDPYTEVETFSGVYRVITVISKFEMGKFVQELTCNLDPLINLSDFPEFLRDLEASVKLPDPTLSGTADVALMPTNATKTQRMQNPVDAAKGQVTTVRNAVTGKVEDVKKSTIGKIKDAATSNIPAPVQNAQELLKKIAPPTIG